MKTLMNWMKEAGRTRVEALANAAGVSAEYLRQIARAHRDGSAELAARVETAAAELGEPVRCGDISKTCAKCGYYRAHIEREELV